MFLYVSNHLRPVRFLGMVDRPALKFLVATAFSKQCCVVHHLFGNASHIDTGAADSPSGALGCRLHEVRKRDLFAKF